MTTTIPKSLDCALAFYYQYLRRGITPPVKKFRGMKPNPASTGYDFRSQDWLDLISGTKGSTLERYKLRGYEHFAVPQNCETLKKVDLRTTSDIRMTISLCRLGEQWVVDSIRWTMPESGYINNRYFVPQEFFLFQGN